jgi:hypothetical protein
MFRKLRTITVIVSAIVLGVVPLLAFGSGQTFASGYDAQLGVSNNSTTSSCLNAWHGGPAVDVYNGMGVANNEFYVGTLSNGNSYIEFIGSGPYNGQCVGDFNNNSGYADTGLDQCPTLTNGGGWGTNFKLESCSTGEGAAFKNNHWGGYLAPGGYSNSNAFYLNHSGQYCFGTYSF